MASTLFTQNIIACVWDFDKTLIPDYMQAPLFRRYGIDEATFWAETNALAENYRKRGYSIAPEISYLNHLLTYVLAGKMPGLGNRDRPLCRLHGWRIIVLRTRRCEPLCNLVRIRPIHRLDHQVASLFP